MYTIIVATILLLCNICSYRFALKCDKRVSLVLLCVAIFLIISVTLLRTNRINIQSAIIFPLRTFVDIWKSRWHSHGKYIFRGLIGNVLLFTPLGLCLSRKEGSLYKYIIPFSISLSVEAIQYFSRLGTFEMDDLICNTIGGILGYELGKQISGQRKGNFIISGIYLAALGVCCLKSILLN